MNSYYEDNHAFIIRNMATTKKTETSVTEIWHIAANYTIEYVLHNIYISTTPRTNWRVSLALPPTFHTRKWAATPDYWRVKLYTQEQTKLTKQMKQPGQNKQ